MQDIKMIAAEATVPDVNFMGVKVICVSALENYRDSRLPYIQR